jgi:hypothetical protein
VQNSANLQQPRAILALLHDGAKPLGETPDCAEHVAFERDRIGEALLGHISGDRQVRRDRLIFPPERLVEAADQKFAEAGGEGRARQVDEIADALESEFDERLDGFGRKAQGRDREREKRFAHGFRRHHSSLLWDGRRRVGHIRPPTPTLPHKGGESHGAMARDRDRTADRIGNGSAGVKALCGKARQEVAGERRLAAEQVGAARDVEHEAVRRRTTPSSLRFFSPLPRGEGSGVGLDEARHSRRVEADERRVAVAPDGLDEPEVRRAVARRDGERRIQGARIGKRHAGAKAERLRRIVHRHDAQRALDERGDDKRRTIRH